MRNELSAQIVLEAVVHGILRSGTNLVLDGSYWLELADCVDGETLDTKSPEALAAFYAAPAKRLLDFGCGTGGHRAFLEDLGYDWVGINYKEGMAQSAASEANALSNEKMFFYGGREVPFDDSSFDVIYSFQVFEHVQDISVTFSELQRVLRPGGRLIGAVSYLEQIHDYSTFNFTPYGFKLAVHEAGLRLEKLYPRSDAFSFLLRRLLVVTSGSDENSLTDYIHSQNQIHEMLGQYALKFGGMSHANLFRLMFSAHFSFDVLKPLR